MSKSERIFRNVFYAFVLIFVGVVLGYYWASIHYAG